MGLPSPRTIGLTLERLRAEQGGVCARVEVPPILDELIGTVLSQHTSDHNSGRAFASLKRRFPTWPEVLEAEDDEIAEAIRTGGMARQKAPRIRAILGAVAEQEGVLDLDRLRQLDDVAVTAYLRRLPGVGPKTAACVLLFAMGRPAFPVDTHVLRVTGRLGWTRAGADAEEVQTSLEPRIPPDLRSPLHLALIAHGRQVCRARRPRCELCVLRDRCPRRGL